MPQIEHPRDAVVRVTRSCICGSDLHLYHGLVPDTRVGMTFGHEFCGVVEEVGSAVENLKAGDHVLARATAGQVLHAGVLGQLGEVELVLDTTQVKLFDPDGGRSLTYSGGNGAGATAASAAAPA